MLKNEEQDLFVTVSKPMEQIPLVSRFLGKHFSQKKNGFLLKILNKFEMNTTDID